MALDIGKFGAAIIKEAMIGQTAGHMAAIPNSPVIYSMYEQYTLATTGGATGWTAVGFIDFLESIIDGLKEVPKEAEDDKETN